MAGTRLRDDPSTFLSYVVVKLPLSYPKDGLSGDRPRRSL
jgi:hypothetical protein